MNTEKDVSVEEMLLRNAFKTFNYLFDAFCEQDYESASLELQELDFSLKKLLDLKDKREKREKLLRVVMDLQTRGINIALGQRSPLLKNIAKNADENSLNTSKIHKKRQQA